MGLSTLFGKNASTRDRPPSDLRHVRHTGRPQRLSLGRQLRTFMCFTTEEKLSQGGGGGDKRRTKRGSLSQRLRLAESCEDQSSCSPLETLSGLVLRPSTCPPDSPPRPSGGQAALSDDPSSFTLCSLNEEQLNAYLKVLFKRCAKEERPPTATRGTSRDISDAVASSGERLEGATASGAVPATGAEGLSAAASEATAGKQRGRKPTLHECEELIHRHEQLFGPIVTSRPAALSHWLPQPATALPEPCQPPEPDASYLSIPQHADAVSCDEEWDTWRRHYSSGPDGVWRIGTHDEANQESTAAGAAPLTDPRPRRLFGALRDRCSALFRHEQKPRAPDTAAVNDLPLEPDAASDEWKTCAEELDEKTLSETKSEHVLKDMSDDEIVPCTTGQYLCPVPRQPRHDPGAFREAAFRPWSRFFRSGQLADQSSPPDEPWPTITGTSELPVSCLGPQQAGGAAPADWLPASLWWGVSPLLEAVLRAADAGRLAALLAQLRPASRRLRQSGLTRLVERLDRPPAPADRQTAWLSRPELPQLFTAAGLGPADMTRWVLRVPHEREDDAVPLPDTVQETVRQRDQQLEMTGNTPCESTDESTPHTTPRLKFFEELMGIPDSDPAMRIHADKRDETRPSLQADSYEHIVIKQTNTSDIATPVTHFSSGWDARSNDRQTGDDQGQGLEIGSAGLAMPLCSDVCTFLLPEYQDNSRAERVAGPEAPPDARLAYETYGTEQWDQLGARRSRADRSERQPKPAGAAAAASAAGADDSVSEGTSEADPVGRFDSETELGGRLSSHLSETTPAAADADCHHSLLRNSSVRPIDSEVDIAQVLHEQSGYATLGESTWPVSSGYQALPLHEVDSETELGLALPLTEVEPPLSDAEHRQVTAYDSETEMAGLLTSLHGADSETEMAERLRRLTAQKVGGEGTALSVAHSRHDTAYPVTDGETHRDFSPELEPVPERRAVTPSNSVTQLPAVPVEVDSETEMGVVLRLFGQGMLSSRYFADMPLPDETDSPDPGANSCPPQQGQSERGVHFSGRGSSAQGQMGQNTQRRIAHERASPPLPIDDMYDASKAVSRKVINKALFLLGGHPLTPPLARTGSSPFGPTSGLDSIELEREAAADGGEPWRVPEGVCDPDRVIPEVRLTTSDGSFVVLFPSRPADTAAAAATGYYETDEGLVLRLEARQQQRPGVESRGFQPTEAGLSLSERELSSARRRLADRCAAAALRRRSPSPRTRASDDGGLRVLYRAEATESWQPVSPEGLSGLSLAPTDPELAAVRWRKSSRGEDGDPEAWSSGGAASPPPPAESQSQTELRKEKPAPPSAVGANSWC